VLVGSYTTILLHNSKAVTVALHTHSPVLVTFASCIDKDLSSRLSVDCFGREQSIHRGRVSVVSNIGSKAFDIR